MIHTKQRHRKARPLEAEIGMAKILRVYQLIVELKQKNMSIEEIARFLSTSERTAYRYVDLLNEVGFETDKDFKNRHFIVPDTCPFCSLKH